MTVTINFTIDRAALEMAIRNLLYFKIKVNRGNIVKSIREQVYSKGMSLIDFPEYWGDDLVWNLDTDDEVIDSLVEKYKSLIGR